MSDVVLTAIVTGAVGVIGNIVQYLATRRTTGVEMKKIAADDARAHAGRVEAARQARRTTYQQFLTVLHEMDRLAQDDAPPGGESLRLANDYLAAHVDVMLDAPRVVTEAMGGVTEVLAEIQNEAGQQGLDRYDVIAFQAAYRKRTGDLIRAKAALLSAIHDDVTKPLLPEEA